MLRQLPSLIVFFKGVNARHTQSLFRKTLSNGLQSNMLNFHSSRLTSSPLTLSRGYSPFPPNTKPLVNPSNFNGFSNFNNNKNNSDPPKKSYHWILYSWTAISTVGFLYFCYKKLERDKEIQQKTKKRLLIAIAGAPVDKNTENLLRSLLSFKEQLDQPSGFQYYAKLFKSEEATFAFHMLVLEKLVGIYLYKEDYARAEKYIKERTVLLNDERFPQLLKDHNQSSILKQTVVVYTQTKNLEKLSDAISDVLRVLNDSSNNNQELANIEIFKIISYVFFQYGKWSDAEFYARRAIENFESIQSDMVEVQNVVAFVQTTSLLLELYVYQGDYEKYIELMKKYTSYKFSKKKGLLEFVSSVEKRNTFFFDYGKIEEHNIVLENLKVLVNTLKLEEEKERIHLLRLEHLRACGFASQNKLEQARSILDDVASKLRSEIEIPLFQSAFLKTKFVKIDTVSRNEDRIHIRLQLSENNLFEDTKSIKLPIGSVLVAKFINPSGGFLSSRTIFYKKSEENLIDVYSPPFKADLANSDSEKQGFHVVEISIYNSNESKLLSTHYQICPNNQQEFAKPKWTSNG